MDDSIMEQLNHKSRHDHPDLLVGELLGLLVDVALVQVGGEGHEAHLGETEVGELDVAERSDEEVVRLEVAVNNTERVEILDSKHSLRKVEPEIHPCYLLLKLEYVICINSEGGMNIFHTRNIVCRYISELSYRGNS